MVVVSRRASKVPVPDHTREREQGWIDAAAWNLEDRGSWLRVKLTGVTLVLLSSGILHCATMAVVRFCETKHEREGTNEMSASTYYALLVPIAVPATVVFVYLNWLSASFFESA
jgi:phosphatidylinositol glycan anchor class Y biosynthesis protein